MEITFKGKTVLVTGSASGIGRATAIMFAESDARVIVHYRENLAGAEETLSMLKHGDHFLLCGDLANPDDLNKLTEAAWAKAGRVDVLVNNAAMHVDLTLTETSYDTWLDVWNHTISTNLSGTAHLSFLMAKKMIAAGGGKIVNVSSRGAFRGEPNGMAYGASKAGLNSLGQSMAKALAPHNIFVYTVAPGFTETEMAFGVLNGPAGDEIRSQSPMNRVAKPEEVAHAIFLLAADGNEWMTGCIVDVNGASYLRT
jgi:NAD(P)-dependent dehydrogenase (short-subunit alcohol dehydrogenase family)